VIAEYAGLFAWSFAAATVLPLSSEVPLAYLVHTRHELAVPVLVATTGNYLGACTTYWLARAAAAALERARGEQPPASGQRKRALQLVRRWGAPALLLSWVPLLGDALVAAAGALRLPFAASSIWLVAGKLGRYLAVAWAALSL
jgi:membrane protein YqaA with SNARE-associated domain